MQKLKELTLPVNEKPKKNMAGGIDCKTCEKEIPAFLRDRLPNRELGIFLRHLDGCRDCQDELSIQYLVYAGMPKLETGETFNLNDELGDFITLEKNRYRRRMRLKVTALLMEFATLVLTLGGSILLVMLW